jgi:hypothetical protein
VIGDRIIAALAAGTLIFALGCGKYGPPVRNEKYRVVERAETTDVPARPEEEDERDAESVILNAPKEPILPVP